MEYFQTAWRDGSSLNKGLTSEEFFYNQIYSALEVNVANRTLPFFNQNAKTVPVELSTGKIINDENLIALEQLASKKGYSSNVWIYGDVLDKMQKQGIPLNLRRDAEPALCLTKYANFTHLNKPELYIAEGGAKTKAQYLYNYDSLEFNEEYPPKESLESLNMDGMFETVRAIEVAAAGKHNILVTGAPG